MLTKNYTAKLALLTKKHDTVYAQIHNSNWR